MADNKTRYVVTFIPVRRYGPLSTHKAIYRGDDEDVMYSHVTAVEHILVATYETGEIEIRENGESRYIEYEQGRRIDLDVSKAKG